MLADGANNDAVSRDDDAISDGSISVLEDGANDAVSVDDEARSCDGSMIDDDDEDDDDIGDDDDKCVAVVGSVALGGGC